MATGNRSIAVLEGDVTGYGCTVCSTADSIKLCCSPYSGNFILFSEECCLVVSAACLASDILQIMPVISVAQSRTRDGVTDLMGLLAWQLFEVGVQNSPAPELSDCGRPFVRNHFVLRSFQNMHVSLRGAPHHRCFMRGCLACCWVAHRSAVKQRC